VERLDGKVCFITGTAGGQGAAAAELFAAEGATVVGCGVKLDGIDLADPEHDAAFVNAAEIVVDGGESVIG
jgi:NAD(P)-dependent dehydrogenase (short-subunit alcohol dehydrogenase family)